MDQKTGEKIRALSLDGVKVDEDFKRYYPFQELASKVLGFTGGDNQGIIGLEVKYEAYLKGKDGKILTMTDARGIELEGVAEDRAEPVTGNTLRISLDYKIQTYAQQMAEKIMEEKQAEKVGILMMDPDNGEILAMVNVPEFNLNDPFTLNVGEEASSEEERQEALNQMWRNGCINDTYEPDLPLRSLQHLPVWKKESWIWRILFSVPGTARWRIGKSGATRSAARSGNICGRDPEFL